MKDLGDVPSPLGVDLLAHLLEYASTKLLLLLLKLYGLVDSGFEF